MPALCLQCLHYIHFIVMAQNGKIIAATAIVHYKFATCMSCMSIEENLANNCSQENEYVLAIKSAHPTPL